MNKIINNTAIKRGLIKTVRIALKIPTNDIAHLAQKGSFFILFFPVGYVILVEKAPHIFRALDPFQVGWLHRLKNFTSVLKGVFFSEAEVPMIHAGTNPYDMFYSHLIVHDSGSADDPPRF
jgi:hypothetical protein